MKKWLTSLFLLFALASGVLAGTPVFSGNAENGMSAMACCKKKPKDCDAKSVSAAQLCCAINCGNPAPSSPGASFNFSPLAVIISDSILKQIASLFGQQKPALKVSFSFERVIFSQKFQPKYIQNHSFLI
jgi:hypothetical protein